MRSVHWKRRNLTYVAITVLVIYLVFRIKTFDHEASVTLNKAKPSDVWEYVADFSNMKDLNPTIINFNVIAESGNYDHWKYSVEYSEHLSHWPYVENHATAHYNVNGNHANNIFYINSTHVTCLLGNFLCLNSNSVFKVTGSKDGVLCEEFIDYQCPAVMSQFCFREVEFQRKAIMKNLKIRFQS